MSFIKICSYQSGKKGDKMFIQCNFEELKRHKIINIEDENKDIRKDFRNYLNKHIFKTPIKENIAIYVCRNMIDEIDRIELFIPLRVLKNDNCG